MNEIRETSSEKLITRKLRRCVSVYYSHMEYFLLYRFFLELKQHHNTYMQFKSQYFKMYHE